MRPAVDRTAVLLGENQFQHRYQRLPTRHTDAGVPAASRTLQSDGELWNAIACEMDTARSAPERCSSAPTRTTRRNSWARLPIAFFKLSEQG
jgi:hypothetical protein